MNLKHIVLSLALVISGCTGTSAKLNDISLGMSKADVISAIGRPDSVSAQGNTEYLVYHWASPKQIIADENNLDRYFVRLVNGKVESYGEQGDFDSTKDERIEIELSTDK